MAQQHSVGKGCPDCGQRALFDAQRHGDPVHLAPIANALAIQHHLHAVLAKPILTGPAVNLKATVLEFGQLFFSNSLRFAA